MGAAGGDGHDVAGAQFRPQPRSQRNRVLDVVKGGRAVPFAQSLSHGAGTVH